MATRMTSRQFNQDTGGAKQAAKRGPVFITDRGEPAYVLLTIEAFERLSSGDRTLFDAISDPRLEADFDFEAHRSRASSFRPVDFG